MEPHPPEKEQFKREVKSKLAWLSTPLALQWAAIILLLMTLIFALWSATTRAPQNKTSSASPTSTPKVTPTASATPAVKISTGPAPAAPLTPPAGYVIHVFAGNLGTARDLQFTPAGTLLVSDPKAQTVTALPDSDRDGVADSAKVVLGGGVDTHGLAFYGGKLYVAELGQVVRYNWDEATLTATPDKTLFDLPAVNDDHNKRTLVFDGSGHLFVSVGSTCNVCRETDNRNATIMQSDADGNNLRVYATGLRNAPFMAINPTNSELWATEMGRDYLGDNTPPDEIDSIADGGNYGWPICYGDKIHDTNFDKNTYIADPCARTIAPIFQVPAHNAPLGLAFIKSPQFPSTQQGDLIVAYHGSWNRTVPDGYKLVRLTVRGKAIVGTSDFLTGFITGRDVLARPVDITFDTSGNLFVSDDKAGAIYIIQKQPS